MEQKIAEKSVNIPAGPVSLEGVLCVPTNPKALIVFVHGSGSSRLSPRNIFVAKTLQENGFATLLFDLLTEKEDRDYENRFNTELLAVRLKQATEWSQAQEDVKHLKVGYFGASTGAAAAVTAAADLGNKIYAVVSRGGRPDLAGDSLKKLYSPILLIVGGNDHTVIDLNVQAAEKIFCAKETVIIPGATHLFEEPGALEKVETEAIRWFDTFAN